MRAQVHLKLITLFTLLASASNAHSVNFVPDPNFDEGTVVGWTAPFSNSISFDATQNIVGAGASGSLLFASAVTDGFANSTLCLPAQYPAGTWDFGGWARIQGAAAGPNAQAFITLAFFASADCSAPAFSPLGTTLGLTQGDTWTLLTGSLALQVPANSALLTLSNRSDASPQSVNFDGIRLGPTPTSPVALQSFEVQ